MSISAINWALECQVTPSQKSVLFVLANYADSEGLSWPSMKLIQLKSGLSERTVRRAKNHLLAIGLIETAPEIGRNVVRLLIKSHDRQAATMAEEPATMADLTPSGNRSLWPVDRSHCQKKRPLCPPHIEPSITTNNRQVPPIAPKGEIDHGSKTEKAKPSDLFNDPIAEQHPCQTKATPSKPKLERIPEQDFDEFWAAYPRKEGKGSARKAFEKARRKISQRLLIRCVLAWPFAEKLSDRGDFRPHPATWLNNERWLDESVRHVLKVTDETPEQREAIAAFNRARDAYIAKISMGVAQSGMKMPVLEDFLAKHAQSTRRDNIAVH